MLKHCSLLFLFAMYGSGCTVNPPDRAAEIALYALLTNDTCPQFQLQNDELRGIQENTVVPSSAVTAMGSIDVTGIRIHAAGNSVRSEFLFQGNPDLTDSVSSDPSTNLQEYRFIAICPDRNLSLRAFVLSSERQSMSFLEDIPVELLENGVRKGTCGTLTQNSNTLTVSCPIAQGLSDDPFQCSYGFRVSYTASDGQRYDDCR